MSTTSDIAVAASYSVSGASLLFKLKVNNFMQFGVRRRPSPPSGPNRCHRRSLLLYAG